MPDLPFVAELLWARYRGLAVPAYVVRAFRAALAGAAARSATAA